jgi:hypothetical protein
MLGSTRKLEAQVNTIIGVEPIQKNKQQSVHDLLFSHVREVGIIFWVPRKWSWFQLRHKIWVS